MSLRTIIGLMFIMAVCIYGIPSALDHLRHQLESRFPRTQIHSLEDVKGIIILGGSYDRIYEAARIVEELPDVKIIFSGRSRQEHKLARSLGFGLNKMTIEPKASNTYENGKYVAELIGKSSRGRWLLITSAIHMPRSMGVFHSLNLTVEPWPVFKNKEIDFTFARQIIHELVALAAYRYKGWTDALFPRPLV